LMQPVRPKLFWTLPVNTTPPATLIRRSTRSKWLNLSINPYAYR